MASGKYVELEALTLPFKKHFSVYSNQLGLIHNKIFESVAKYHLHGAGAEAACLKGTLEEAGQDNLIMPLIESAPHIMEMLQSFPRLK